jgi:hypothetical protein
MILVKPGQPVIFEIYAGFDAYDDFIKESTSANTAAMPPKTTPTHVWWTKALKKTQSPRKQMARLDNFIFKNPPLVDKNTGSRLPRCE